MMNDAAMNHTPNLVAFDGLSSRNRLRRSIGDQMASPNIVSDDELTIIPTKLTREKPRGTAQNCGHNAAEGVLAREAKSGALLMKKGSEDKIGEQHCDHNRIQWKIAHDVKARGRNKGDR
jgi:hypothetical protein